MGSPKYDWWGYVKSMIRRYPDQVNESERAAVEAAMTETKYLDKPARRLKVVKLVLMDGSHTLAGAALQVHCSEHSVQRFHADFIRCVAENFRCDGLL